MKNHENLPGTTKNQPGTMNNYENLPGTIKTRPETMKNHENATSLETRKKHKNPNEIMKNHQPGAIKIDLEP